MTVDTNWKCDVCGQERDFNRLGVRNIDRSSQMGLEADSFTEQIKFCNDNPDCIEKSKKITHIKEE